MMAVIGFRLHQSEHNAPSRPRQPDCYIWVLPPENPLGLEHTLRFQAPATQAKTTSPNVLSVENSGRVKLPNFTCASRFTCGRQASRIIVPSHSCVPPRAQPCTPGQTVSQP